MPTASAGNEKALQRRPARRSRTVGGRIAWFTVGVGVWCGAVWLALRTDGEHVYGAIRGGSLREVAPVLGTMVLAIAGLACFVLALTGLRRPRVERLHPSLKVPDGVAKGPGLSTVRTQNWPLR